MHLEIRADELTALRGVLILHGFPAPCFGSVGSAGRPGEESGDDARSRHEAPAWDGGRNLAAGGPTTTIARSFVANRIPQNLSRRRKP